MFSVGELARLTGITVRALHHYDEIGLVVPSERTAAGYRMYTDDDVRRLQEVLVLREIGVPLGEIAAALDADRDALLRRHRQTLVDRRGRLDAMIAAIDSNLTRRGPMQPDDVKAMFDGFDHAQYEQEAEARWGATDAYQESARRTKGYGEAEWEAIRTEAASIYARLAALMPAAATDPDVQALVEAHRAHIDRWFYPCSRELHHGLGAMYVADPRFTANLDKIAPGFARYLAEAIAAS